MQSSKTKQIALCGVLSALAVTALFLGAAIGIGIYAGPLLAVFATVPILCEYGCSALLTTYFVISVLAMLLVPDPEAALVYIAFGWYPALQGQMYRIRKKVLRIPCLLLIYGACCTLLGAGVRMLLGISAGFSETVWINGLFLTAGAATFLAFDTVLLRLRLVWKLKIRPKLRW
ncbi:MAG: hypothetical protein HUJ80_05690 [Firmicutes bacterium]|nr:hypothetical protein [Bacillota bacterium]